MSDIDPRMIRVDLPSGTYVRVALTRPEAVELVSRPYCRGDGTIGRELVVRRAAAVGVPPGAGPVETV